MDDPSLPLINENFNLTSLRPHHQNLSNVKCTSSAITKKVWILKLHKQCNIKRKPPNRARAKSLVEMMIGKKMFQWPSSTDSALLQQLVMKTKNPKENEALLILTQHPVDPVHKHTQTKRVIHRKTEGTRTH